MTDLAIRVDGLGKRYRLGVPQARYGMLRESLSAAVRSSARALKSLLSSGKWKRRTGEMFWALRNASFEVRRGEVLGIIGRNGAGKSTLLKVLSRITEPTEGQADIYGHVGSLLEVGTGFHPELTGRENVYLNGAILGMRRAEITAKFDEIVAFAEVERFIDTPVKRYSSGMYLRLAFSIAAHLEPEILIVDEVLAVGDASFQKKCLKKMGEVGKVGRTVHFVSHDLSAIARLAQRTLLLEGGRIAKVGDTGEVIKKYLDSGGTLQPEWVRPSPSSEHPRDVILTAIRSCDSSGRVASQLHADEPFFIEVEFEVRARLETKIEIRLKSKSDGTVVFMSALPDQMRQRTTWFDPGHYRCRCHVPAPLLQPGNYYLRVVADSWGVPRFDEVEPVLDFEVTTVGSLAASDNRPGSIAPLLKWDVLPTP
jgi:lipopolysaccharide transport system ATP-binding protein